MDTVRREARVTLGSAEPAVLLGDTESSAAQAVTIRGARAPFPTHARERLVREIGIREVTGTYWSDYSALTKAARWHEGDSRLPVGREPGWLLVLSSSVNQRCSADARVPGPPDCHCGSGSPRWDRETMLPGITPGDEPRWKTSSPRFGGGYELVCDKR